MKIAIPVQSYHPGNTSDYVLSALLEMGHQAVIINTAHFVAAHKRREFDLYFCVDSGEVLELSALAEYDLSSVGFWSIDFRHNKDRPGRNDRALVKFLAERGAYIFQANFEDFQECQSMRISRCAWLPMAADPGIWRPQAGVEKKFDLAFVGNVWDEGRLAVLRMLESLQLKTALVVNRKLSAAQSTQVLQQARLGFNVNSFYGTPYSYDLNMRFFETLSCGLPLVTNYVPAIDMIAPSPVPFLRTYRSLDDLASTIHDALASAEFMNSATQARSWIEYGHTYRHRVIQVLSAFKS